MRVVREVAVHLEHELGAVVERASEPGEIRRPEPFLARPVEHVDVAELGCELVRHRSGAVGRAVVDHEHARAFREHAAERAQHRLDVLALVVGRQADGRAHRRIIAFMARSLPANADVADQLELLADILEIEGEQSFRVLAYRRAATRVRETGTSIAQLALDGKARELQGIGTTIEGKIVQIVEDGEIHALTKHRQQVPPGVVEFVRLPGLGAKTARRIWLELDVTTIEGLREAAEAERLRTLSGLGPKVEENILRALAEQGERGAGGAADAARDRPAVRGRRGRRAARASVGGEGLGGGERAPAARDRARPRHHRDGEEARKP